MSGQGYRRRSHFRPPTMRLRLPQRAPRRCGAGAGKSCRREVSVVCVKAVVLA